MMQNTVSLMEKKTVVPRYLVTESKIGLSDWERKAVN